MIVVDTSALVAILLNEPEAGRGMDRLQTEPEVLISAGTLAEALVVAGRRGFGDAMATLVEGLGFEVIPVTASTSAQVADAHARWGKGAHPAALNLGDCFAYALARDTGRPLLFVGDDFARTDVEAA